MKSSIAYLLCCLWLALTFPLQAQVQQAWITRHALAPTGTNQAVAIALDKDGNIIVSGHGTTTNGDFDYVVLKYAPAGTLMWEAKYGSMSNDMMRGMAVDRVNGIILTGTGGTVKWSASGMQEWGAGYGGRALAVDLSGDVYLTGHRETSFSTMKLHRNAGTNLWERTHVMIPGQRDVAQVIAVDGNSNVFVGGEVICYWEPRAAYAGRCIISYNPDGATRWQTPLPQSECIFSSVRMIGIATDSLNNVYAVSETDPGGFAAIKYGSSGEFIWTAYASYVQGGLRAMTVDRQGHLILTGRDSNPDTFERTISTEKINPSGSHAWIRNYVSATSRNGNGVAVDEIGSVYVTGQIPSVIEGNDYATIKYSPTGEELWVQRYDGPALGDDVATAIAVAPDGSVYVTGWSTTSSNLVEITTIKYTQSASLTMDTNRTVNLQFPAAPGASNRVQATTNFLQWLDLGWSLADTNGLLHFLDTNAPNHPFRFYRTVSP